MSECFRSAVAAHRIDFAYGKRPILRDVSLDVRFGEVVGLLGPNGTGKSTLMAVMAGDVSAHSGYVEYQGKKVQDYGRKRVGSDAFGYAAGD